MTSTRRHASSRSSDDDLIGDVPCAAGRACNAHAPFHHADDLLPVSSCQLPLWRHGQTVARPVDRHLSNPARMAASFPPARELPKHGGGEARLHRTCRVAGERRQADQTPIPRRALVGGPANRPRPCPSVQAPTREAAVQPAPILRPCHSRSRSSITRGSAAKRDAIGGHVARQCRNAMRRPDAPGLVRPRHRPPRASRTCAPGPLTWTGGRRLDATDRIPARIELAR